MLAGLAKALRSEKFAVTAVPLNVPDIVWTLPEKAVKLVAPKFPGWKQATVELRKHNRPINPKDLFLERYALRITIRSLRRVLAVAHEHGLEPDHRLKGAVARVTDAIENPGPPVG